MKHKKIMLIALSITGFLLLLIVIGRVSLTLGFGKQVAELFSLSKDISKKTFTYKQLIGLPEPVQRYFTHVLKEGQPYISYIRMTHDGQFKPGVDKDWVDIEGEQYATTETPGFIWKGKTTMFTARDLYIDDKGKLTVSLFSVLPIVNSSGEVFNQGELLRWLGESVLYPTNLLSDERLSWSAVSENSARLTYNYNGMSLFFIVTFNDAGEIIQLETKRHMDEKTLETWVITLANYKWMNGVLVPTTFEVFWRLAKGDLSYARFRMKIIEYGKPARF